MHDAVLLALFPKQRHQLPVPVTCHLIGMSVLSAVPLLHSWEMPVQCRIEILPVTVAQRHTHAKADDSVHFCINTVVQDSLNIFPRVIDKWQDW